MSTPLDVWIDPLCPWAWLTSRWITDLAEQDLVSVRWHLFSLTEVNRKEPAPEPFELKPADAAAIALLRARDHGGDVAFGRLYTELGTLHHEDGRDYADPAVITDGVRLAGLPAAIGEGLESDSDAIARWRAEHEDARAKGAFGVPTLSVTDGIYLYGPIVDVRVTGEAAADLWSHADFMLRQPHVWELKRERTSGPQVGARRKQEASAAG